MKAIPLPAALELLDDRAPVGRAVVVRNEAYRALWTHVQLMRDKPVEAGRRRRRGAGALCAVFSERIFDSGLTAGGRGLNY